MIGEHEIAGGFHSFWSEALPLLTPACVTVFNRSYGDYLEGFRPVDKELELGTSDLDGPDLLAEAAFELFRYASERRVMCREVIADVISFESAWRSAEGSVSMHRRLQSSPVPEIGSLSHRYLLALGRRYDALRETLPFESAVFSPRLDGCGVLGACEADISLADVLIEVKTVNRNFSSKDIRQVVIYLALAHLSGQKRWSSVVLFNPRRSFLVRFDPTEFIGYVSAGKGVVEVYRELERFLLHRDLTFEHRF